MNNPSGHSRELGEICRMCVFWVNSEYHVFHMVSPLVYFPGDYWLHIGDS